MNEEIRNEGFNEVEAVNETTDLTPCETEETSNGYGALAAFCGVAFGAGVLAHKFVIQPIGKKVSNWRAERKRRKEAKKGVVDGDFEEIFDDPEDVTVTEEE